MKHQWHHLNAELNHLHFKTLYNPLRTHFHSPFSYMYMYLKVVKPLLHNTAKLVYKDHLRDQQNVVFIHRWSSYADSIA